MTLVTCLAWASDSAQGKISSYRSFCEDSIVRDYEAILRRMPRVHAPPPSGRLPFAPVNMYFEKLPRSSLVASDAGGTRAGFAFSVPSGRDRRFRLDWVIDSRLVKVDFQGREKKVIRSDRTSVGAVASDGIDDLTVSFGIGPRPAIYRFETIFRKTTGERVAKYGWYIRVLPRTTSSVQLGVEKPIYQVNDSVLFRLENFSTKRISYGLPFSLEHLSGASWVEHPLGLTWWRIRLSLPPGLAGRCQSISITNEIPEGLYRVRKTLGDGRALTAEFEIRP